MFVDKIKNKGQGRLFRSDYLEIMTKSHPVVIYSLYLPVIGSMLYYGAVYKDLNTITTIIMFIGGMLCWTLVEYILHRYLFHFTAESPRAKKVIYTIHGVHHEFPRDRERLFMPPVPSLIIASVIFSMMYGLLHVNAFAFFPGFLFGYLIYGSMHYAIHAFAPPKYLKALWRNHHLHHYKTQNKGFGVSSTIWDIVFGTVPKKEEA